jgi:hypothetical protein
MQNIGSTIVTWQVLTRYILNNEHIVVVILNWHVQEILVPPASAQNGGKHNFYKIETANHFTTCKPTDKNDPMYKRLLEVLEGCVKNDTRINISVDN